MFTPSFHTLPLVRWWLAPLNAVLCRSVDDIVPLTRQEARGLMRAYLAPGRKTNIIGWGAPPPDPAMIESADAVSSRNKGAGESSRDGGGALTLLCVGRLGQHKGQLWLLEIYRDARERFNKPVRLVLVGRDEGDSEAIAGFVADRGLGDEVTVTGEVSDDETCTVVRPG